MKGKQVIAAVIAVLLATAVLPPAAAWAVNRRRVSRAEAEVSVLARRFGSYSAKVPHTREIASVLCGPGRVPVAETASTGMWIRAPRANLLMALPGETLPEDPWGNCYLVNVTSGLVLSAGPDGTINTDFAASTTSGDDVGAR
jgi:hypothetical protein